MNQSEFSKAEDTRFDHLMDVELQTAGEAWETILRERTQETKTKMGTKALQAEVVIEKKQRPKQHRYSRRGGRSYPVPSDSDLDPYWNDQAAG